MTIYTATFRTDAEYAREEFQAPTPERALAHARAFYDAHYADLDFQHYDMGMPVNEIEITDCDYRTVAVWQDETLRLHLAASSLLHACEVALERLEIKNCQGEEQEPIALLQAALAEATGAPDVVQFSPS